MDMGVIPVRFDPRAKQTVNKTIRMDEALMKQVYEAASGCNLSFNQFVVQCIEFAMQNLAEKDADENHL